MKKPVLYFTTIFVVVFTLLLLIFPVFGRSFINSNIWLISVTLKPYIENRNENREIRTGSDDRKTNTIITNVIFLDRQNSDGSFISKNININLFNEVYIPFALMISMILGLPIGLKKLLRTFLFSFCIYYLFTTLKICTLIFDNYRFPEWKTVDLPYLIDRVVYFFAFLLSFTGFSISLTVIILIFTIAVLYNYKELKNKILPELF